MDLFQNKRTKKQKLNKKQQQQFVHLLEGLLTNGFSLKESFYFMEKVSIFNKKLTNNLSNQIVLGKSLADIFLELNFEKITIIQINFAQMHGNLANTLKQIDLHMQHVQKYRNHFYKILSYPLILFLFLIMILIGIRQFIFPQLLIENQSSLTIQFIYNSPYLLLGFLLVIFSLYLGFRTYLKRKDLIQQANFLGRMPILGIFYKDYLSELFAFEWGKLFTQGLEIRSVIQMMKQMDQYSLVTELAREMEKDLEKGILFHQQLQNYSFFTTEFSIIIQQGEIKGHLGKELIIYSGLIWKRFFNRIERSIQWVQPMIFLLIAILIISIYTAMLLPIYGNMEEFL
ncbi:competence type IV pilus assembly protein ComGB [Melissococcus plutonius]|uniref:competence type IV pilus assembly protein ComGB n=1 Tax=Melissococcus plutonius TaxID=33970 RepID=UPI000F7BE1D6|nr:competence type IV pilus assembly protein ComGB [Melissococcus plutonius]BBD15644.1 late competence protein ComGB, access of DNA to ComEA [Melissococcus plutonius]